MDSAPRVQGIIGWRGMGNAEWVPVFDHESDSMGVQFHGKRGGGTGFTQSVYSLGGALCNSKQQG